MRPLRQQIRDANAAAVRKVVASKVNECAFPGCTRIPVDHGYCPDHRDGTT